MTGIKSGVYQIKNKKNEKIYIGSSVDISKRWNEHKYLLNNNKGHNKHLQSSWSKYGGANFEFSIILCCAEKNLLFYEQLICLKFETLNKDKGYNYRYFVESNRGLPFSEEHKRKLSKANKGNIPWLKGRCHSMETKKKLRTINTGKHHSKETKEKLSQTNKGKKLSSETKIKMSNSQKGKKLSAVEIETIRSRNYGNTYNLGKKKSNEARKKQKQSQIVKIRKNNYNGHLNEEAIKVIKFMQKYYNYKGLQTKLSKLYKISRPTLADIRNERTWSWVKV